MNLVYDHWKVEALKHKEKILENYKLRYRSYKTFMEEMKTKSIPEQRETLASLFSSYDAMRPDTGIFVSIEDFLKDPFVYLPIYENVRMWQDVRKEFPLCFLSHYDTWEKREIAQLRGQNALVGASIVDNLSSIVGFDFFSGIELKKYERMPSDFAHLNIQNSFISASITQEITHLKSCLMFGTKPPFDQLCLPFDEVLFFPQLEEICHKNPEFSIAGTAFSEISMSDLIFVDGQPVYRKYPGMKDREYAAALYQDLCSGEHRVDVAVAQYVPAKKCYAATLIRLLKTDAPEASDEVSASMSAEQKQQYEEELAGRMTNAREEYEVFYYRIASGDVLDKTEQNHKEKISGFHASDYFYALNQFYEESRSAFAQMCAVYTGPVSAADYEYLYLFFIDPYGKLETDACAAALEALVLGDAARSAPVLDRIVSSFAGLTVQDYLFHDMDELFENLDHYYPLYLKTQFLIRLSAHFPYGIQKRIYESPNRNQLHQSLYLFPVFYSYAKKLSHANGYSFETNRMLPADAQIAFSDIFSDEVMVHFILWINDGLKEPTADYAFPLELSSLRWEELISITMFPLAWLRDALPEQKEQWQNGDYLYLDGKPLSRYESKQRKDLSKRKAEKNAALSEQHTFKSQLIRKSSLGHHILSLPVFTRNEEDGFELHFVRIFSGIGIAPDDHARAHLTAASMGTAKDALLTQLQTAEAAFLSQITQEVARENKLITQKSQLLHDNILQDVDTATQMSDTIRFEKEEYTALKKEADHFRSVIEELTESEGKGLLGLFKKNGKKQEEISKIKEQLHELERKMNDKQKQISYQEHFIAKAEASRNLLKLYKKKK